MKIQLLKAALGGSMLVAIAFGSNAAHAATTQAEAKARVVAPVTLNKIQDLDFGAVVPGISDGTVTIAAAVSGARTCVTVTCTGTTTAANFSIVGTAGETVTITSDPSVQLGNGASFMTATLAPNITSLVLDGTDGFYVGGTLTVLSTQAAGNYSAQFNVTVNYQ